MPELTSKERLQPSLLDRLTDEERDTRLHCQRTAIATVVDGKY